MTTQERDTWWKDFDLVTARVQRVVWVFVGAALLGLIVGAAFTIDSAVFHIRETAGAATALLSHTDRQLNGTAAEHGTDGAIFAVKKSLDDIRAGAVIASRQERQYYAQLQRNTDLTFANANASLAMLNAKLDGVDTVGLSADTRALLVALTTDAQHVVPLLDTLRKTVDDLDLQISDPQLHLALVELEKTATGSAEFMQHLNAIIADVQGKVNAATHPTRKRRALTALLTTLKTLYYVGQVVR